MEQQRREIVIMYRGQDVAADQQQFWVAVQAIESRHLPYFITRPGVFEDDAHERLKDNFFCIAASGRIILLQAESSTLPPEIVAEVQAAFTALFAEP